MDILIGFFIAAMLLFVLWVFFIFLPSLAMYTVRVNLDPRMLFDGKLWNWRAYVNPHAYGKWLAKQAQGSLQALEDALHRSVTDLHTGAPHGHTAPVSFGGNSIATHERECVVCAHVWTPKPLQPEPCPNCGS